MAEAEVTPVAGLLGKADRVLDHVAEANIAALIDSISEPGAANEGLESHPGPTWTAVNSLMI